MRQLLIRVPDELHQRLTARAHREGRSVNAIATEMLDTSVDAQSGSPRAIVRARAAARGILHPIERSERPRRTLDEVHDLLRSTSLSADELIDEQRGPR